MLPTLAPCGFALLEVTLTVVNVGAVLSNVTDELSVVAATCVPGLPATSVKSMVNGTFPSVLLVNNVYSAL
ncbi:hypothetical protein D3C85_1863220 [compost metagenome]